MTVRAQEKNNLKESDCGKFLFILSWLLLMVKVFQSLSNLMKDGI